MRIIGRYDPQWVNLAEWLEFTIRKHGDDGTLGDEQAAYRKADAPLEDGEVLVGQPEAWFDEGDRAELLPVTPTRSEEFFNEMGVCPICSGKRTTEDGRALCPKCHGASPRPYEVKGRLAWLRKFVKSWELKDANGVEIPCDDTGRKRIADSLPSFMVIVSAANGLAEAISESSRGNS